MVVVVVVVMICRLRTILLLLRSDLKREELIKTVFLHVWSRGYVIILA